jgi:hypothetical protein
MANKVKIVGYAKKEFFNNGIEYRNFSPNLVGNQFTSDGGTALFTIGNFRVTTNIDGKVDKNFVTKEYSDYTSLDTLKLDGTIKKIFYENESKVKLNLNRNDVLNYAFFGSLREYIRVSLENIIINWPASIKAVKTSPINPELSGLTALNYYYDITTNKGSFEVSTERLINSFGINYVTDGSIIDTFNESNDLRNIVVNNNSYNIANVHGEFPIVSFSGASGTTNSTLSITVMGNAFPLYSIENIDYHIKPNDIKFEEFFISLNDFENNLLNRNSTPNYTGVFNIFSESEQGGVIESNVTITWPVSDGYNIDFNTTEYDNYVGELLTLAEVNDSSKSNLMTRFLVSTSISEFDTIPDITGSYGNTNGQKMTNTLKIYGREFDELKRYGDGIAYANVVSYDKKNNTPDIILKNLARVMGWDLTSSIGGTDLIENYLKPKKSTYEGQSIGLTNVEAEVELWRRIILNTPWIWKSKGTRKAIEFLFKFIGTPDGLITFNEYIYVADKTVDVERIEDMMEYFNNTRDITDLNVDYDGYPKIQPNTPDMYFQKAGLWYRTTGGLNPDIDILYGNNPHIGPYDGGQAYIDQFTNCLIPNFVGVDVFEDITELGELKLFTNYNNGTFGECCEGNAIVDIDTNVDFSGMLNTNITQFLSENPNASESGCTITSVWTLKGSLSGETFYEEIFFSGAQTPTYEGYIVGLDDLITRPELSGVSGFTSGTTYTIIDDNFDCGSTLIDVYLKIETCLETTFDCIDEGEFPDANITSDSNQIIY